MRALILATLLCLAASPALADLCTYRPGEILADAGDSVLGEAIRSGAGFDLSDVASGANLLSPSEGGNRIAEVTGVVAAAVSAPVSVVAGVIGITAFEGVCSLRDARRSDSEAVLEVLRYMAEDADPAHFQLTGVDRSPQGAVLRLADEQGELHDYAVRDLEIVDGELRERRLGRNRVLGRVTFRVPAETLILRDEPELLEMPEGPAPLPEVSVQRLPPQAGAPGKAPSETGPTEGQN